MKNKTTLKTAGLCAAAMLAGYMSNDISNGASKLYNMLKPQPSQEITTQEKEFLMNVDKHKSYRNVDDMVTVVKSNKPFNKKNDYREVKDQIIEYLEGNKQKIPIIGEKENPKFHGFDAFVKMMYAKVTGKGMISEKEYWVWNDVLVDITANTQYHLDDFSEVGDERKFVELYVETKEE